MNIRLFQRRLVPCPTRWGWVCLLAAFVGVVSSWWFCGEAFLSLTERVPAEVLVVEGWVGMDCPRAVATEFEHGGYRWIVITGGLTGDRWSQRRWSYVEETHLGLIRNGVSNERIIDAPTGDPESRRTFEMAEAAWRALYSRKIQYKGINVFTRSSHARRSRLVFAKVFGPGIKVGAISWTPPGYQSEPWWRSSVRGEDMLKETVGYFYELLLNSGRWSNAPAEKR